MYMYIITALNIICNYELTYEINNVLLFLLVISE